MNKREFQNYPEVISIEEYLERRQENREKLLTKKVTDDMIQKWNVIKIQRR